MLLSKRGRTSDPTRRVHCWRVAAIRLLRLPPLSLSVSVRERHGVAARTGCQLYDLLIIAAALEAGCATSFSGDLQDGQVIDRRLVIRDPFAGTG